MVLSEVEKRCLEVSHWPNGYLMYAKVQRDAARSLESLGLVKIEPEGEFGRVKARQSQPETEER